MLRGMIQTFIQAQTYNIRTLKFSTDVEIVVPLYTPRMSGTGANLSTVSKA